LDTRNQIMYMDQQVLPIRRNGAENRYPMKEAGLGDRLMVGVQGDDGMIARYGRNEMHGILTLPGAKVIIKPF